MSKSAWFLVLSQCLAAPVPPAPGDDEVADSGSAEAGDLEGCQGGTWVWEDELTHDGCDGALPDGMPHGADVGMRVEDSVVVCEEEGFTWTIGEFTFECVDAVGGSGEGALTCVARGAPEHTLRGARFADGTAEGRWTWARARDGRPCETDWSFIATRR